MYLIISVIQIALSLAWEYEPSSLEMQPEDVVAVEWAYSSDYWKGFMSRREDQRHPPCSLSN